MPKGTDNVLQAAQVCSVNYFFALVAATSSSDARRTLVQALQQAFVNIKSSRGLETDAKMLADMDIEPFHLIMEWIHDVLMVPITVLKHTKVKRPAASETKSSLSNTSSSRYGWFVFWPGCMSRNPNPTQLIL
jgi:hypothetical protein